MAPRTISPAPPAAGSFLLGHIRPTTPEQPAMHPPLGSQLFTSALPPSEPPLYSSAASDLFKRQVLYEGGYAEVFRKFSFTPVDSPVREGA